MYIYIYTCIYISSRRAGRMFSRSSIQFSYHHYNSVFPPACCSTDVSCLPRLELLALVLNYTTHTDRIKM